MFSRIIAFRASYTTLLVCRLFEPKLLAKSLVHALYLVDVYTRIIEKRRRRCCWCWQIIFPYSLIIYYSILLFSTVYTKHQRNIPQTDVELDCRLFLYDILGSILHTSHRIGNDTIAPMRWAHPNADNLDRHGELI